MDGQIPSSQPDFNSGRGQIAENCVEYYLFIVKQQTDARIQLQELEALRKAAISFCNGLTKNYIWQRGEFHLELKTSQGMTYLYGVTDYGDAVEDEWLIVYILRRLTQSFPDLWVRVADADGEILLIEAANALPKWITPDIDQNRVWIHDSKLLLIPLSSTGDAQRAAESSVITLRDAVQYLRTKPHALTYSTLIESEAFYRLEKYPEHIDRSLHYSLVTIPRKLAYILHEIPKSLAMAVEKFYLRDAFTLKSINSASAPLVFPPRDFITTSVQFSKVLFAQLKSQHMEPPPAWQSFVKEPRNGSDSDLLSLARRTMGMKLTCGFEMLARDAEKSKYRFLRELAILLQDLAEDGDAGLPTDQEIQSWQSQQRDDAEDWMDIDFRDFERELDGTRSGPSTDRGASFGDSQVQNDLRKIVSRFEAFLSDDRAGLDGIELEKTTGDEHEDTEDEDEDSEFEDKAVSFDEETFAEMMRHMMGMPSKSPATGPSSGTPKSHSTYESTCEGPDSDSDDVEQLSSQMEAELKGHGALNLKSEQHTLRNLPDAGQSSHIQTEQVQDNSVPSVKESDEELNIDYNLAQNLLESFKGQAGMAGPTGNLLSMMGFTLPRDEDDS